MTLPPPPLSSAPGVSPCNGAEVLPFDRPCHRIRRARAVGSLPAQDRLFVEAGTRLLERLEGLNTRFPLALDLGAHHGVLGRLLAQNPLGGIERLIQMEATPGLLTQADPASGPRLGADEEALPFAPSSFDLVLSSFALHWVNDLPGCLIQIRQALKPHGLFLAVLPGGNSLVELRHCLLEAEHAQTGGASPRVAPMLEMQDAAHLLARAGFVEPVSDRDRLTLTFPSARALFQRLHRWGESNALSARLRRPTRRAVLTRAMALLEERHAAPEGGIAVTLELIYLTGWASRVEQ